MTTPPLAPLVFSPVQAGFPSPAENYLGQPLDLNEHLVPHPAATFFVRVSGDSMKNAGISTGDILIVDRSLEASDGKVIIGLIHGEFTVKRLQIKGNRIRLLAENPAYPPIVVNEGSDFQVWGVVTYVIKCIS